MGPGKSPAVINRNHSGEVKRCYREHMIHTKFYNHQNCSFKLLCVYFWSSRFDHIFRGPVINELLNQIMFPLSGCKALPVEGFRQSCGVWQRTLLLTWKLLFHSEGVIINNHWHHGRQEAGHYLQILRAGAEEDKWMSTTCSHFIYICFNEMTMKMNPFWTTYSQTLAVTKKPAQIQLRWSTVRTNRGSLKTWLSIMSHAPWPSDSILSSSIRSGLSCSQTHITRCWYNEVSMCVCVCVCVCVWGNLIVTANLL